MLQKGAPKQKLAALMEQLGEVPKQNLLPSEHRMDLPPCLLSALPTEALQEQSGGHGL